jgi:hypothetical protein
MHAHAILLLLFSQREELHLILLLPASIVCKWLEYGTYVISKGWTGW